MGLESGAFALERRRFGDRGDRPQRRAKRLCAARHGGAHHAALLNITHRALHTFTRERETPRLPFLAKLSYASARLAVRRASLHSPPVLLSISDYRLIANVACSRPGRSLHPTLRLENAHARLEPLPRFTATRLPYSNWSLARFGHAMRSTFCFPINNRVQE